MIVWSVDAGLRGAITAIDHYKIVNILRMPLVKHPTSRLIKHKINPVQLSILLASFPTPDFVIIELPEVINTNARITIASLFQSVGIIDGVIGHFSSSINYVTPRKWKNKYNLIGCTKWDSVEVANRIFPELKIEMVKDADISEAALIGHWFLKYSGFVL